MRSNRTFLLAGLAGLALGGALPSVAAAQDGFQLPPSSGETGTVQGPVAEGVPPPRSPQPTPSPTPAPRPTQAIEPIEIPAPAASASPSPAASPAAGSSPTAEPGPATSPAPTALETDEAENEAADEPATEPATDATRADSVEPARTPQAPYPAQVPLEPLPELELETGQQGWPIPWALVFLALLALAGAGAALWWWRRESTGREIFVIPTIQRPRPVDRKIAPEADAPSPNGSPAAPPASPHDTAKQKEENDEEEDAPANPLRVALEPRQLRLSLVNATLSYRLLLTNSGEVPLTDIAISGDMISAHSSLSREQQVAAPNQPLEPIQTIERLGAGESRTVSGQFQLPLPMIRPIRRGEIALFVPLARLSIVARGENGGQPTVITSVVGQIPPRGAQGLQPFRLDLGPRTYSDLSQRAFA